MGRRKRTTGKTERGRLLGLLLAFLLFLGLAACAGEPREAAPSALPAPTPLPAGTPAPTPAPEPTPTPRETPEEAVTLAIPPVTGAWGPFDAAAGGDRAVQRLTQLPLLFRRADGSFPESAGEEGAAGIRISLRGEDSTVLRIAMREDIRFSDGSYADASDLLFTLYFLLDPGYDGQFRLRDCALAGLREYRCRCSSELLEKYGALFDEPGEEYAQAREDCLRLAWDRELRALTEICREEYLETYAPYALGIPAEDARENEGALRAFTMWCAGLAESADDEGVLRDALGRSWRPAAGDLPGEEALYELFSLSYPAPGAFDRALGMETEVLAREEFIRRFAAEDPENLDAPAGIRGIQAVDDYNVDLYLDTFSAADLERLGGLFLASLRGCGEESLFRPEEGSYGFVFGEADPSAARSAPGAGAYVLREAGETGLRLEKNAEVKPGSAAPGELWLLTAPEEELLSLVAEEKADLACLPGSAEVWGAAGELPQLTLRSVATDVYGWLELDPAAFEREDEALGLALREAVSRVAAACCRRSAAAYFGAAASILGPEETPEEALEAASELLGELPEGTGAAFLALVAGGGSGAHPCWEGLLEASRLLSSLGVALTVTDAGDDAAFWAAVDGREAALWAGASHELTPPGENGTLTENRQAVYRRLDLLAVNNRRVDVLTLPVELTWCRDHLSILHSLALK